MEQTSSTDAEQMVVHQAGKHNDPLNAETKLDNLTSHYVTPISALFHRNHDDVIWQPKVKQSYTDWLVSVRVDEEVWREQGGKGKEARVVSVMDLVESKGDCNGLEHLNTMATIECAGNRRQEISEGEKAEGIQWGAGAAANVYWSGASIRSLLLIHGLSDPYSHHSNLAGLTPSDSCMANDCAPWAQSLHLHLLSAQPTSESERPEGEFFEASIPLSTAMHPNQRCILAHQHNGKTLEQAHGFPLRAVIPGHAGARWVKWIRGLRVSKEENESPPMKSDYKILSPPASESEQGQKEWKGKVMGSEKDVEFRKEEIAKCVPMQRLGVGSAIELPLSNAVVRGEKIKARGYAVGQDGSPVSSVECIILAQRSPSDDSFSLRRQAAEEPVSQWTRAEVQKSTGEGRGGEDNGGSLSWAWSLWEAEVPMPKGDGQDATFALIARATTTAGVQQEMESPWNVRGFQTRSWPVVRGLRVG